MFDNTYLKLKVNVDLPELEFNKPLEKIEFDEYMTAEQITYYPVEIELIEENENNKIINSIGYIDGYYYDMEYLYEKGLNIYSAFDMCSGDTAELYNLLFEDAENIKLEYQTFNNNIFYLDRIYIEKEYRKKGYAKLLLNQLDDIIQYIAKLKIGLIVVCAQPFEKENGKEKMIRNDKKLEEKLIKLYKNTGFKVDTNSTNYLVKIVE